MILPRNLRNSDDLNLRQLKLYNRLEQVSTIYSILVRVLIICYKAGVSRAPGNAPSAQQPQRSERPTKPVDRPNNASAQRSMEDLTSVDVMNTNGRYYKSFYQYITTLY